MFEFVGSFAEGADAAFGPEEKLHEELGPEDIQHFVDDHEGVVEGAGFCGELGDVGHEEAGSFQSLPEELQTQICFGFLPRIVNEWG